MKEEARLRVPESPLLSLSNLKDTHMAKLCYTHLSIYSRSVECVCMYHVKLKKMSAALSRLDSRSNVFACQMSCRPTPSDVTVRRLCWFHGFIFDLGNKLSGGQMKFPPGIIMSSWSAEVKNMICHAFKCSSFQTITKWTLQPNFSTRTGVSHFYASNLHKSDD